MEIQSENHKIVTDGKMKLLIDITEFQDRTIEEIRGMYGKALSEELLTELEQYCKNGLKDNN